VGEHERSARADGAEVGAVAGRGTAAPITGLLVLSAIGAELLAAYDDSTGRLGRVLVAVVFFGALYGAPALVVRDLARRWGWGWPSILLLAMALGTLQPAVIDQSLFSAGYREIEGWSEWRVRTFMEPLGFSAQMAVNFVVGHVIYSFCGPIAIAEAWRPAQASRPWLGVRGTLLATATYALAAALVTSDATSRSASATQLIVSTAVALAFVCAAAWAGRRPGAVPEPSCRPAPGIAAVLCGTLVVAFVVALAGEGWAGVVLGIAGPLVVVTTAARASRAGRWSVRHTAAVALGFLACRGLLAFTYFPLVGDVSATRKYAHNVAMLAIVALAGWVALRPSTGRRAREEAP
jgi:hypothetical protein